MSLINDALKRAQAQATPAEPPTLHFRPADPSQPQTARRGLGLLLPVGFSALALLGLFLLWQRAQPSADQAEPVNKPVPQEAVETINPAPAPAVPKGESGRASAAALPETPPVAETASAAPALAASLDPGSVAPPSASAQTPVEATKAPEAPKPPELKLQAIVFNPARPSAVVSGKTVFVGSRVAEWHVSAIARDSATLVSGGTTNVLTLE